eukprot:CAMPEP_0176439174 /NCGR_PEP_ID=MMETSP0127-20121128/19775_1 /TAXON_ID=938130 /ORGANISM="Platyophrya macrostoma, Strain WH" /LENGTH=501 /DNA_ID=CAMNT_0017823371 /DNA_START=102 /DNA_END=1607 /DNA_ORIENTATION=+
MSSLDDAITTVCAASASLTYVTEPELDAVITMLEGLKVNVCAANVSYAGNMTVAQTNSFWSRLCGSLVAGTGLEGKSLRIMALIALDAANHPMILGCLQAIGETLDAFLSRAATQLEDNPEAPMWSLYCDVLKVFYRAMDYDLSAVQVLDLVNRKPSLAVGILDAALRSIRPDASAAESIATRMKVSNWQSDVALAVCISKNLYQLSLHATYFDGADAERSSATAASQHHDEFAKFMNGVVQGIVNSSKIMETSVALLVDWLGCIRDQRCEHALDLLPWLEVFMSNLLSFIANVLSKTDESAVVLRKHVAAETTLVPDAVLPYLSFVLDWLERQQQQQQASPNGTTSNNTIGRSVRTILLLLKLLSFMTHKVKLFRPHVKAMPTLIQRILTQPLLWNSPYQIDFIALCTRLCVNAELEVGTAFMEHVAATALTRDMRAKVAWRLTGAADDMYPINTLSETYPKLESLFDESIAEADTPSTAPPQQEGSYAVSGNIKGEIAL